ncbi:zinc ribbon domain-containing protein [Christensenellaceae bacterium OttesenSCG-928-K19]|nr:zinc ribbon domain-containing protein [Christensenellaceae bacterium OttesenSCG-928-K19]
MAGYRKAIKEHFEAIPAFKKVLDIDFIFWGVGLALYVLGGCLLFVIPAGASAIAGVGLWMAYFGIALAFIKKNDWGLMITFLGLAIFSVINFIITIAVSSGYGVSIPISLLFDTLAFGTLFILSYRASDTLKNAEMKRAQEAALLAQQVKAMGGTVCPSCGAVMEGGAKFCNVCGTKRPDQQRCVSCGNELAVGAGFCNRCGAKVAPIEETKPEVEAVVIKCASCGRDITRDDAFCPGCGAKIPLSMTREGVSP